MSKENFSDNAVCKNCIHFEKDCTQPNSKGGNTSINPFGHCQDFEEGENNYQEMDEVLETVIPKGHTYGVDRMFLTYNEKFNSYSVNVESVANYLIQNHTYRNVKGTTKEFLYLWNGKIFEQKGATDIKEKCEKILKKYAKKNPIDEILNKVRRKTGIDKKDFEKNNVNFVNLKNGIWDIKNKKLIKHNPKYNFTKIIDITKYKTTIKESKYLKFIEEALYPEDIPVFQELLGFILFREYFIKKGFIFVGEMDTGKSVMIDSLINFVGEANKCGLSLQDISSGTKFTKNFLKGKYLNCYDDLSSRDINDGGAFKMVTGGGWITGEEKFGDTDEFKSFAKQVLAGNKIPPVKDNDDIAYFGRWIIIRFDNPPVKINPFLRNKIFTEEERSWALNWALEGLDRLLKNSKFSYNKTPDEVKKIMEMSGDPLIQFGEACLRRVEGGRISKDKMYNVYCVWAHENDKPILSKEQLGRRLNSKVKYLVAKKDKERFWANGEFKGKWGESSDLDTLDT